MSKGTRPRSELNGKPDSCGAVHPQHHHTTPPMEQRSLRPEIALVYYTPVDGRWTRRDLIGIEGGRNLQL